MNEIHHKVFADHIASLNYMSVNKSQFSEYLPKNQILKAKKSIGKADE
jgi:hypothetical protein